MTPVSAAGESVPTFRELQARCGDISSSVLSQRVRELRDAGIVASEGSGGYSLTDDGRNLLELLAPLDAWAKRWAERTDGGVCARDPGISRSNRRLEDPLAKDHGPSVKNDKQYEGLRKKGMSKSRAAAISNSPGSSSRGGKSSGSSRSSKSSGSGSGGNRAQKQAAGRKGGKKSS